MDRTAQHSAPHAMPKPLPLRFHALSEPVVALVLIAAPFVLGFSDIDNALGASIVAGVLVLLLGATTRWRWSLVPLVPLGVHAMADTVLGALIFAAPFLLEYHDDSTAAWIVHVVIGTGLIASAWSTDWRMHDRALPPSGADLAR
jgi:predicted membrane protein